MAEDLKVFLYENLLIWEGNLRFIKRCYYFVVSQNNKYGISSQKKNNFKIFYAVQKSVKTAAYNMLVDVFFILSLCRMVQI